MMTTTYFKSGAIHAATLCATCVTLLASDAMAGGFALSEQGPTSSALGNAVTARRDLPEAGFFNPAAYALSTRVSLSGALLVPTITHDDGTTKTEAETGATPIPQIHAGAKFGDMGLSLSLNVPFGSGVAWPEDWAGRYESTASSLQVIEVGSNVSYLLFDMVALSAGGRVQSLHFSTARKIDTARPGQDASVNVQGSDVAFGGQASALVLIGKSLTLGLSYRSHVSHQAEGVADFEDVPIELESRAHDTNASTNFVMPTRLALGGAFDFGPGIVSADVEYFGWGRVDQVVVDFEDEGMDDVVQPRNWSDTFAFRVGYEHRLLNQALALRGGFSYDMSPAPDETIGASSPDGNRLGVHAGVGYDIAFGLSADLALGFVSIGDRDVINPLSKGGRYSGQILSTSLGVSWHPGAP